MIANFHRNGLLALNVDVLELFPFNDDGIRGGGNEDVLVKPMFVDELSCSKVGGFAVLANGFGARTGFEPNGFVPGKKDNDRSG